MDATGRAMWSPDAEMNERTQGMINFFKLIKNDDKGATAIEYGLIAALIAVAIITAVSSVGTNLSTTFNSVASNLK